MDFVILFLHLPQIPIILSFTGTCIVLHGRTLIWSLSGVYFCKEQITKTELSGHENGQNFAEIDCVTGGFIYLVSSSHKKEPWKFHWDSWHAVRCKCQLSFQCDLAKLFFPCAVWLWDHVLGILFMKCSLCIKQNAKWLLWTTDFFSPLNYVLWTLLWKLTSRMNTFCKNLYNTVIKNIYNPRKCCVKSCAKTVYSE